MSNVALRSGVGIRDHMLSKKLSVQLDSELNHDKNEKSTDQTSTNGAKANLDAVRFKPKYVLHMAIIISK